MIEKGESIRLAYFQSQYRNYCGSKNLTPDEDIKLYSSCTAEKLKAYNLPCVRLNNTGLRDDECEVYGIKKAPIPQVAERQPTTHMDIHSLQQIAKGRTLPSAAKALLPPRLIPTAGDSLEEKDRKREEGKAYAEKLLKDADPIEPDEDPPATNWKEINPDWAKE